MCICVYTQITLLTLNKIQYNPSKVLQNKSCPACNWISIVYVLTCWFLCSGPAPSEPPPQRTLGRSRECRPARWSSSGESQRVAQRLWFQPRLRTPQCHLCKSPAEQAERVHVSFLFFIADTTIEYLQSSFGQNPVILLHWK